MTEAQKNIERLESILKQVQKRQDALSVEIVQLRREILRLKGSLDSEPVTRAESEASNSPQTPVVTEQEPYLVRKKAVTFQATNNEPRQLKKVESWFKIPNLNIDFEKFIGENLISKIGILILIIGVAIGAKYSIENNLISPLTRIVLGYLAGIALLGVGLKLRAKYENYSAVLVSGAMTILYFITFMAYSFYELIPQTAAFGLMALFTVFTVVAALSYNKQVIAIIGLVGAYAVPFLLSDGSGNYVTLLSYVALVNAGILVLAFKKNWKPLYYSAFALTWMIFFAWLIEGKAGVGSYQTGLIFATLYFGMFYLMFLAFKLINKEQYNKLDVVMLIANSFLYYGAGYYMLSDFQSGKELLGIFTLANAFVHFIVSTVLYKKSLADSSLFYLVSGLVLVFIAIAIPVQLDGNWVTLLWIALAALLFWIGKTKQIAVYERLAYPLVILALGSLLDDWDSGYKYYYSNFTESDYVRPFLNIQFLSSMVFSACLGFIVYTGYNSDTLQKAKRSWYTTAFYYGIPAIFVIVLFYSFQLEIVNFWNQFYYSTAVVTPVDGETYTNRIMNHDYNRFGTIWVINFGLLFTSLLAHFCMRFVKHKAVSWISIALVVLAIFSFLSEGLMEFTGLRESYINSAEDTVFDHGMVNLWLRYVSYGFVAFALWTLYKYVKSSNVDEDIRIPFDILLHLVIVGLISSEIIHVMDLSSSTQTDKLGVSIFWGVYSLALIAFGIWKGKKHLRIGGMVLFALTLLKLFFYDISHMNTIAKTIVFVSLGVLLLIISFLYNKYKHLITDEDVV